MILPFVEIPGTAGTDYPIRGQFRSSLPCQGQSMRKFEHRCNHNTDRYDCDDVDKINLHFGPLLPKEKAPKGLFQSDLFLEECSRHSLRQEKERVRESC